MTVSYIQFNNLFTITLHYYKKKLKAGRERKEYKDKEQQNLRTINKDIFLRKFLS